MGGKIVETYVKGYFKYDRTDTPTAYLTDSGYSKGFLIMWNCSSWEDGVGINSRNKVAYYDWTLDVELGGEVSGEMDGVNGSIGGGYYNTRL